MKKQNIKTPSVFVLGLMLMYAVLLTTCMASGTYARYTSSATGSSTATVAQISYQINAQNSNHSVAGTDLHEGAIFAVEETFTIVNDGDVSYDYSLDLTLTDVNGAAIPGYTLNVPGTTPQTEIHVMKSGSIEHENVQGGMFYYERLDTGGSVVDSHSSANATITGTLPFGASHTYRVRYNIDMRSNTGTDADIDFGIAAQLRYAITCTQID